MTKQINVGGVKVGGGAPVSIQSMLNTATTDVVGSLAQLRALKTAGCEIARLAVPDMAAAEGFRRIAEQSPLPLVADIHFDYRLAIAAAEAEHAPVLLQTTPGTLKYAGTAVFSAMVRALAEKAAVPVALHLDHGDSFDLCAQAAAPLCLWYHESEQYEI